MICNASPDYFSNRDHSGKMALEHIHQEEMKSPSLTRAECVLAVIAAQPGLVQFSSNLFGKNVFPEKHLGPCCAPGLFSAETIYLL